MASTHGLSSAQRAVLNRLLTSRLADLEGQRRSRWDGLSQVDAARQTLVQDADDAAQQAGAHEVQGSVSDIDSVECAALRSALQRLQGPDYGLCLDCGVDIGFERLRAQPQALRCAACQAALEYRDRFSATAPAAAPA